MHRREQGAGHRPSAAHGDHCHTSARMSTPGRGTIATRRRQTGGGEGPHPVCENAYVVNRLFLHQKNRVLHPSYPYCLSIEISSISHTFIWEDITTKFVISKYLFVYMRLKYSYYGTYDVYIFPQLIRIMFFGLW